jgi:MOSC domain-containing protein YiiM
MVARQGHDGAVTIHHTTDELAAGLDDVRAAPADGGTLELIVRRPAQDEREVLEEGRLDPAEGLVGDTWKDRGSRRTEDGGPHPDMQLNVMNARAALLAAAGDADRRALAGDQLFLDISHENLPAGTRLAIGDVAVIEVTDQPHTGCAKFAGRFGQDAVRFFNSPEGKALRLRGLNAKVVVPGPIRRGDGVRKLRA